MKKGKHYYNNGIVQHVYLEGEQPEGFIKGGLSKNKGKQAHNKGMISVYKDGANKYINKNDLQKYIDLGYIKTFVYTEKGAQDHKNSVIKTRKNKSNEQWLKDHIKRSNGAKQMWENRDFDEVKRICAPGLNKMMTCSRHSTSKEEGIAYDILCNLFGINNVEHHYNKDPRYPWYCDFYIKCEDLFIELNIFPTHYREPFNKNNNDHLNYLQHCLNEPLNWLEKCTADVWGRRDVEKLNMAIKNNLNYKVFYSMEDFYNEYRT